MFNPDVLTRFPTRRSGAVPLLRTRFQVCFHQCSGSVAFCMDPDPDPDPALFVSDFQDANKNISS